MAFNKIIGAIDDDAATYLNGQKVGEHRMADHANGWGVPIAQEAQG